MSTDGRGIPTDVPAEARAYAGFEGHVGRTVAGSQPWWPPRPTARDGAPNVVVILCDDLGFADIGCFGSEIPTPHLDRLAAEGLRYTNFHVTPMCSPTRAALLTGRNSHAAGVGYVAHADPGFPGLAMELADDVTTVAEVLRDNGYATLAVGKWHLCKDTDDHEAASRASWPVQRGFDRFYGFLGGFTDYHHPPALVVDNSPATPDRYPDGYYFTDDITERAAEMVRSVKASNPSKPFFLYFAHGAVHAPLQAKAADIERHRGAYDAGWDAVRAARFQRQQELGVVPANATLSPRNAEPGDDVRPWEDLSDDEKRLFARYMEVYAAMVTSVDDSLGRLRHALEELGEWDNTLLLFTSDNGASREGEDVGSAQYLDVMRRFHDPGGRADPLERDLSVFDDIGGPRTLSHYPRGWAMASNTPFRLYKINTHAGGHSVPAIVSWPVRLAGQAGGLRRQYVHVTDVYPAVLDLLGLADRGQRDGTPVKPLAGTSFAATLADGDAAHGHTEQYYVMQGHRGFYRDGWEVVTRHPPRTPFGDHEWQLYDLRADPTETRDLAGDQPDRVAELAAAWERAAWANQVFPLDEGSGLWRALRPERDEVFSRAVTLFPGTPTLDRFRSLLLINQRPFSVTARVDFRPGDRGTLVAHGTQGGGYAVVVDDDRAAFVFNGYGEMRGIDGGPVPAGPQEVVLSVELPDPSTWNVEMSVAGEVRGRLDGLPSLVGMAPFQGIDVGIDRRSPVSWERYERDGTFPYSGLLRSVTYTPGPLLPEFGPERIERLRAIGLAFE